MPRCQWERTGDSPDGGPRYICTVCRLSLVNVVGDQLGTEFADSLPDCRGKVAVARERPAVPPGIIKRATAGLSAATRWMVAGRPRRSFGEITRIYDELCQPCPQFMAKSQSCGVCGCRVSKNRAALLNKIRMATESCPRGKW